MTAAMSTIWEKSTMWHRVGSHLVLCESFHGTWCVIDDRSDEILVPALDLEGAKRAAEQLFDHDPVKWGRS